MARPKKIKVGKRTVTIEWDMSIGTARNRLSGKHFKENIKVSKGLSPLGERHTLFHELVHDLWEEADLHNYFDREQEETIVEWLTPQILYCLRNNPELAKFLLEDD